jgi:Xaa-Pro aminopeptidase
LRRKKEPDELRLIGRAIAATEKMYQRAREIVRPGINELDVFNELQEAAVSELREPLTATGNDYQCGQRGGAPRDRKILDGELYILDLGPAYRGYFADNARTIAVGQPTEEQLRAWEAVVEALATVERMVRPGGGARDVFHEVQRQLDDAHLGVFNHHLGHGIGLFPHETPHLNPSWDDVFEEGDVFTAEPGLYDPQLRAGIRLENDYVVTEDGIQLLTPFPLQL